MTQDSDIYFEISESGNVIRLEPIIGHDETSNDYWDNNWIHTKVIIKGGVFSGQFTADFMTTDFELLKRDFIKCDKDFKTTAKFEPLEGQLILKIAGDGLGHFEIECYAIENPGYGASLSFNMSFDQTYLSGLINQLDKITKAFPIKGDFHIRNE